MFHTRKRSSSYSNGRSRFLSRFSAPLTLVAAGALSVFSAAAPLAAHADPVASDGAVGVNAQWEAGTSPIWYIELQRQGIYDVAGGIKAENDSEIRAGLQMFDWGFAHQGVDGSFPNTAGGSTGPAFHSTSLFVEAAARAALLLKSYSPVTYTPDSTYYAGKVAQYAADTHLACQWMTAPSVQSAGQLFNLPYTHRRYLLAACLAETGALSNDSALTADALAYARDGVSRQLPAGWTASLAPAVSGVTPPATLVAPGTPTPATATVTVNASGVNPELGGYDSGYQCMGLFYANTYLPYCADPALKAQLVTTIANGLTFEEQFIAPDGTIGIAGDTRMGVEKDRNGTTKMPTIPICWAAFDLGAQNTGQSSFAAFSGRIDDYGTQVATNRVSPYGAVDDNQLFDKNRSMPWSISNQKIGVDYVERGMKDENDALIQTGIQIIDWGFLHQNADGSFGATSSPFYGDAAFVETASRAAHELQSYAPHSYTPVTNYAAWSQTTLGSCVSACNWLISQKTAAHYNPTIAASPAREWTLAAALAETGAFTSTPSLQSAASSYATNAVNLQMTNGEDPETGTADVNYQALGLNAALHYAAACGSASSASAADNAADNGLLWEGQFISPSGTISGTSSPALLALRGAYSQASGLQDGDYFDVALFRLGGIPVE